MTDDVTQTLRVPRRAANTAIFLLLAACILTSAGQLSIDIYVPALPDMARFFHASPQAVQSSVTSYMVAYAFGQLTLGPVADAFGRKPVLTFGLVLFTLGCILMLSATSVETFIWARCLQGFGIAATNLVSKVITTDAFTGRELMHAFTYVSISWGVAPVLAPALGAHLQTWFGWHACIMFLLVYAVVMFGLTWYYRETLAQPVPINPRVLMRNTLMVLRSPVFQTCFLSQGLCFGILLVFNLVAPFMVQDTLHRSHTLAGYFALLVGTTYLLGGLSNRLRGARLPSPEQRLRIGTRLMLGGALAMLLLALTFGLRTWTLAIPTMMMAFCSGAIYPTLMARGNSLFPDIVGLTSAILGFALLLTSAILMRLAGFISLQTLTPLAVFFVLLSLAVMAMVARFLRYAEEQGN